MKAIQFLLLISLLSFTEQTIAHRDVCPPWFVHDNRSKTGCSCHGSYSGEVKCGPEFPELHLGFCMTYNSVTETTEYGPCPYIGHYNTIISVDTVRYIKLPTNVSILNEVMCGPLNREGELCGKCKDGYGIALYSYTMECSKCWEHGYGFVLYFFLELFPITVMYFLVVIFHIRATSSPLSALVFMSQIIIYTTRLNVIHVYIENDISGFPYVALQVLLVLCGIWTLDFFRSVIPPFCVSSSIKNIHALAFEYLAAFYPIFLILITYVCIELHNNNFKPVVWLWKPFHRYFVCVRRRWDSKASIINAFTTFLLLSFSKSLFVSFTLLYIFPVQYNYDNPSKYVLYYDPTVESHALEYSIFAAIASSVLVIFIFLPTVLLILYPTRLFRKCASCCGFRRWYALHMFVESFQGQYKDGTNGTHDFRMASASFLILRILTMASFMFSLSLFHNFYVRVSSSYLQYMIYAGASCFYAVMKPYKSNCSNNADFMILALLSIMSAHMLTALYHAKRAAFPNGVMVLTLLLSIPHMVLIFYVCYVLAKKASVPQCLKLKYEKLKSCVLATRRKVEADVEAESHTGSLPDRLINPEEYPPVLSITEEHITAEPTENKELVNKKPRILTPVYTYGSISSY